MSIADDRLGIVGPAGLGAARLIARAGRAALSPSARAGAVLVAHAAAFAGIYLSAFSLRFDGRVPAEFADAALATLPVVVGLKLMAVLATGTYLGWWRMPTFADLVALTECAALGSLIVAATLLLIPLEGPRIPRSVLVLDGLGTVGLLCATRGALRLARERYYPLFRPGRGTRALVVGAGSAGVDLVRAVQGRPGLGLRVVGLIDDDPRARGRVVAGVRVIGGTGRLAALAARSRAEVVLIPTPAVPARVVRELVDACNRAGLRAQVVPGVAALLSGRIDARPRDVAIEDLLGREPVRFVGASVGRFLSGKSVLVTGAAGSIGSEICRQMLALGPRRLVLLDTDENGLFYLERELRECSPGTALVPVVASVRDASRLRRAFDEHRPAIVFHAAAHKHVPLMESNPASAVANNVLGTRTVVDEAVRAAAEALVLISTDKAVNPTSVMGATKRLAELYVRSRAGQVETRLVAVRFGNVLGSNGSVVPTFQNQIRRGGPVTVTHPEMTRYFMTIPEASQLVLQAGALGRGGEIFVLDMGLPVRIVDLARDLIRLSGLSDDDVELSFTGLRPGEKLFEELHDPGEPLDATRHPKIFVARSMPPDPAVVSEAINHLGSLLDASADVIVSALREALPEYRPTRPSRPSSPDSSPLSGPIAALSSRPALQAS